MGLIVKGFSKTVHWTASLQVGVVRDPWYLNFKVKGQGHLSSKVKPVKILEIVAIVNKITHSSIPFWIFVRLRVYVVHCPVQGFIQGCIFVTEKWVIAWLWLVEKMLDSDWSIWNLRDVNKVSEDSKTVWFVQSCTNIAVLVFPVYQMNFTKLRLWVIVYDVINIPEVSVAVHSMFRATSWSIVLVDWSPMKMEL